MANLKEVRLRIQSIKSTRQITSAMKMVSASKLHKSQQKIILLRVFAEKLHTVLQKINVAIPVIKQHPFTIDRGCKHATLISIASNKGLCGTYNASVAKRTMKTIRQWQDNEIDFSLHVVGKKNEAFFCKQRFANIGFNHELIDNPSLESASQFADQLMESFYKGETDRVMVVYHRFKNAVVQELTVEQLLPIPLYGSQFINITDSDNLALDVGIEEAAAEEHFGYIMEPGLQEVIETLVPYYLNYNLFRIFIDAVASEHGARMTSMHIATDNADQLLKELTLTYNKVRQSIITREIMEIVGGAEVFNQ